jgi:hypothetical protein
MASDTSSIPPHILRDAILANAPSFASNPADAPKSFENMAAKLARRGG